MMITAKIYPGDGVYCVRCDALEIYTQGPTREDAIKSLADVVGELLRITGHPEFKATITDGGGDFVDVSGSDPVALASRALELAQRSARVAS